MKVLIADDDPIARFMLERYLTEWGKEFLTATDGAEAWQLFQEQPFPLVLTDWLMPHVDGIELIRRIRAHPRPGYVYTILVTSLTEKDDLVQGMDAGADDFMSKPYHREELRVRLQHGERVIELERSLAEQNRVLRETQAALVQQEKQAGLGQLAAGMAHEVNNPIAFVSNNLTVLRRDALYVLELLETYRASRPAWEQVAPDQAAAVTQMEETIDLAFIRETLPQLFDKTVAGLQRVRDIVRNLRDFASLDEASFKEVDVNAALLSTAEILGHERTRRQVTFQTQLGDLPAIACRPGKINQVFLNILQNAIQASSPGSVVEIRTRLLPGVEVEVEGAVEIEVEDHGCGIAPEHLPRLFEPFFTTKPVGQGRGLGLAVSYGIVRDHGGTIEVESKPGQGSDFRIRLPVRPQLS